VIEPLGVVNYLESKARKYDSLAFDLITYKMNVPPEDRTAELTFQIEHYRRLRDSFDMAAQAVLTEEGKTE
jgi:hypothetical protein